MSWPPKWDRAHFKEPHSLKVARFKRRLDHRTDEDREKREVRLRDKYCRWPICGCRRMNLARAVAHDKHKGMGGNPAGDRSKAPEMILLCSARHRENVFAWDRGTIDIRPLTTLRFGGPCAFFVDVNRLKEDYAARSPRWVEVGRESALHTFDKFTPAQVRMLETLAEMDL